MILLIFFCNCEEAIHLPIQPRPALRWVCTVHSKVLTLGSFRFCFRCIISSSAIIMICCLSSVCLSVCSASVL